ncbi:arsenate reductase ArsC [Niveispirillum sp. SYP-B3756]|uniref:arsenate reductase ArsC n=1 Tax=Niveispirillum sp. SYP-B3756 TaxID=2662178 RepID=UPI0012925C79|nr:arsenate reductase ArsC [Niveispirillum sp. SYP-B3756]MQP64556.1 arsenate reductase ArsC [Niveispirillum sp. SYP-B3756]
MTDKRFKVLFICRKNAARSLMAEALLRRWGMGRFEVYSAGPEPLDQPNPQAMELLRKVGIETDTLHPKSWDLFAGTDAPVMDFIFYACEDTAKLHPPHWPGQPMVAQWNFPDPLSLQGSDIERHALLNLVFGMIERRVKIFCALPDHRLAKLTAADMSDIATGEHAA